MLYNNGVGFARSVVGSDVLGNHSWVGAINPASTAADVLQRLDWLIDQTNYLHIVEVTNGANPLLPHAYNAIWVSATSAPVAGGTASLDPFYVAGRLLPDLVAPLDSVTSAAALLLDAVPGHTLLTEVTRALLTAGADRVTRNSTGSDLVNYAPTATNCLDVRYGAGQLNIHTSSWAAIASRNAFDEAILGRDATSMWIRLTSAFEQGFTNLQFIDLAADAANCGAFGILNLISSVQTDNVRHAQIGGTALKVLIANGKKRETEQVVDISFWRQ